MVRHRILGPADGIGTDLLGGWPTVWHTALEGRDGALIGAELGRAGAWNDTRDGPKRVCRSLDRTMGLAQASTESGAPWGVGCMSVEMER